MSTPMKALAHVLMTNILPANFPLCPRALPQSVTRGLCALLLVALLPACVRQMPVGTPAPPQEAEAVWQRYAVLSDAQAAQKTYRLQMSLRYGTEGDTRRVTALLWGNSSQQLRLDVNAGVGATVAKIQDDGDHFLVYAPMENKAYFHQGSQKPLLDVGVPMPFGVTALADLLNGRYAAIFGNQPSGNGAEMTPGGNLVFHVEQGRIAGMLELNRDGLPVGWKDGERQGWSLQLGYEDGTTLPYKLEIAHGKTGKRAIVLIKERSTPATPFTPQQLRLILPEDTPVLPLRQFKQT